MRDDSDYSWSGDESDDESEIVNERTQQENDEYNILEPELNDDVLDKQFDSLTSSIITPDKDIIPDAENLSPAYIVFDNYEIILQWNRSLRFSLAVCTLKEKFENAL